MAIRIKTLNKMLGFKQITRMSSELRKKYGHAYKSANDWTSAPCTSRRDIMIHIPIGSWSSVRSIKNSDDFTEKGFLVRCRISARFRLLCRRPARLAGCGVSPPRWGLLCCWTGLLCVGHIHHAKNHEAGEYYRSCCWAFQNGGRFHIIPLLSVLRTD